MKKEAVKKKKIIHKPNTKKKSAAKKHVPSWQDEYFDYGFMCLKPVNGAFLELLGEQFVEWCTATTQVEELNTKARRFSYERWLQEKGIAIPTMHGWRKRCPFLEQSIKHGMMILGNRLEEGLITKEYSERYTMFTLHNYLDRHGKNNRYHADLKNVKDIIAALFNKTFENVELDESNR